MKIESYCYACDTTFKVVTEEKVEVLYCPCCGEQLLEEDIDQLDEEEDAPAYDDE